MEEMSFNGQSILFDREATSRIYQAYASGSSDHECAACRNFRQFRHLIYSSETLNLLIDLGIDPAKEWEAYVLGDDSASSLPYLVHFPFVGRLFGELSSQSDQIVGNLGGSPIFTTHFDSALDRIFGGITLVVCCFIEVPKSSEYDREIIAEN